MARIGLIIADLILVMLTWRGFVIGPMGQYSLKNRPGTLSFVIFWNGPSPVLTPRRGTHTFGFLQLYTILWIGLGYCLYVGIRPCTYHCYAKADDTATFPDCS